MRHVTAVIKGFSCKRTAAIFAGHVMKGFPSDIIPTARRKLAMLHAATALADPKVPPANRLEALKRDRAGQHSIRINDQWRLCFTWRDGDAFDVEITDYH